MISTGRRVFTVIFLTLSLASFVFAQQGTSTPVRKDPDFVDEKGFKGRVFDIKHRDPAALVRAISLLGSGFKGALIQFSSEFKTITVRDFPENIAAIEDALKRLDTPEGPRPEIELRVHVLIASNTPLQSSEYPAELNDVVKQMQGTLSYKHYGLMTSAIHRTKEGRQGVKNTGVAESDLFGVNKPGGNPIFYNYAVDVMSINSPSSGAVSIQMDQFTFDMRVPILANNNQIQYESVGFRGPVNIRENERVVVGTTAMGNRGLVVVLTAKVIK